MEYKNKDFMRNENHFSKFQLFVILKPKMVARELDRI